MRILIVGAGAVGGYFGGRLAQAGRDVTFLVRPSRAKQLGQDGLRIISPYGDAVLTPKLVTAEEISTPYDLVFLSVKAYALEATMNDFAAAVGPETMILPVLNGMRHVDLLTKRFGEYAVQTLDATLQGGGFDARLSTDIMQAMWEKWVQLASLGAITCLMRGTIGEIVDAPGGAELSLKVVDESAAIATACGHKPSDALLSRHARAMTAPGSQLASSMYRDLRKGAPVEVDHILGDFIERGDAHRVAAPLLKAAFINLRVYQGELSKR
jgi:2-dehydropantoate 2-reductase